MNIHRSSFSIFIPYFITFWIENVDVYIVSIENTYGYSS